MFDGFVLRTDWYFREPREKRILREQALLRHILALVYRRVSPFTLLCTATESFSHFDYTFTLPPLPDDPTSKL